MKDKIELISVQNTENSIVITIPKTILKFVAENHPEYPVKVRDADLFQKAVAFEIQHNIGSSGSGLTGLQEFIDEAICTVAENGDES